MRVGKVEILNFLSNHFLPFTERYPHENVSHFKLTEWPVYHRGLKLVSKGQIGSFRFELSRFPLTKKGSLWKHSQ